MRPRPDSTGPSEGHARSAAPISMSPALELMRALLHVSHGIERMSKKMEASIGVTAQQRLVVRIVGRHPGVTPGRLAEHLHLDPGTVSALVRRLEGKGLVARTPDPRDGRRATLGLTERGRALDQPETGTVEAAVDAVLRVEAPERTRDALALLARLAERLEAEASAPPATTQGVTRNPGAPRGGVSAAHPWSGSEGGVFDERATRGPGAPEPPSRAEGATTQPRATQARKAR